MSAVAEHTGPALATSDERGRTYTHPTTGETFISVTTALKAVNKEALVFWAAGLAAQAAIDNLPRLITATRIKACGNTWARCAHDWRLKCSTCPCEKCPACVAKWLRDRHIAESSRRADEGTRAHDVIEHWVLNDGEILQHDADIDPSVAQFLAFVADYGLTPKSWEMAEATVINREYGYAGTLDQVVRIQSTNSPKAAEVCARLGRDEVLLLADTKTRGKSGEAAIYPEHALQCSGYRNCTHVLLPDGREEPLPAVDGAFVLQLRPDGYEMRLVVADDRTFGAFLSVLSLAKWQWQFATASVSTRAFPAPKPEPQVSGGIAKAERAARQAPTTPRKATKATAKTAEPEALLAAPPSKPLAEVAAMQSATLRSMTRPAHPDSPYGDDIPF